MSRAALRYQFESQVWTELVDLRRIEPKQHIQEWNYVLTSR